VESGQLKVVCHTVFLQIIKYNVQDKNNDIASFANDAIKFVSVFGPPISQSVPHIYLSGLPFTPMKSQVTLSTTVSENTAIEDREGI
jgi:hypothetical protein